jgi:hypothetical protein
MHRVILSRIDMAQQADRGQALFGRRIVYKMWKYCDQLHLWLPKNRAVGKSGAVNP